MPPNVGRFEQEELKCVQNLKESFPQAAATLDRITRIHRFVDSLEIDPFFEPPCLFDLKEKPQLLALNAALLATWVQHVSHGTRVRLRSLEAAFLSELCARRFMTAMILARSHMEGAGLATFAESALMAASDTGDWNDLKSIIHQMLFGTSFRLEKNLIILQDELPLEVTEPVRPTTLLKAMDDFFTDSRGNQTTDLRGIYALLCEYAHPNIGGAKAFDGIVNQGEGWYHSYQREEDIRQQDVATATDILLNNMKLGYSNALLLVTGEIEEIEGGIRFHKPPVHIGKTIWEQIIQV